MHLFFEFITITVGLFLLSLLSFCGGWWMFGNILHAAITMILIYGPIAAMLMLSYYYLF